MMYYELTCLVSHEASEAVVELLHRFGAAGVSIEDSSWGVEPLPDRYGELYAMEELDLPAEGVRIKAYIAAGDYHDALATAIAEEIRALQSYGLEPGAATVSVASLDEEDWAHGWKQFYKPVQVSERLLIVPSWEMESISVPEHLEVIQIEPGMAFGTGTHATTVLCMRLLEQALRGGEKVIDVGCGTAILSIAAAKLGASRVLACDLDSVAVEVAQDNVKKNAVDDRIHVQQGNLLHGVTWQADVVVANILAEIVLQLTQAAYDHLLPGGWFISSGIIEQYADDVEARLQAVGFSVVEKKTQGDWVAFLAQK
ncbi:50S ribosomal protein L11 methyltransferase [Fodinisporobacter ferrooxydans]|uniref:Ribosomal protein L11 methyltransferase n=1 Tax=Fodinisporobacter ferrooxydans TaxID=2901836 RepID=A0ABY4CEG0_9BACL|nr:50S ribosomal protein L11 methyltransferase [Alicyclobacillaceae bacterium MYW30-H2]